MLFNCCYFIIFY